MVRWPYADYRWWSLSLYSAIIATCDEEIPALSAMVSSDDPSGSCLAWKTALELSRAETAPAEVVAASLQCGSFRKWKLADPSAARMRAHEAIAGFVRRNEIAKTMNRLPAFIEERMRRILAYWLPDQGVIPVGKFGPGAVAERHSHYVRFVHLADWCDASDTWPEQPRGHADFEQVTCRLCSVPKTFEKDRLITVEPTYGSYAQQQVRTMLLESIHAGPLAGTCMDLGYTNGQAIQRRLALRASLSKKLATVDLRDASDNITWDQVVAVFPGWVHALLSSARSTRFYFDDADGNRHSSDLHIYAGMGNATTFVIETLFFSALVKAWAVGDSRLNRFVSCFGDDVICANEVASQLAQQGFPCFNVNTDKSFIGACGLRESCGIFAYNGIDVTPIRIDGYPPSLEGTVGLSDLMASIQACNRPWMPMLEESIVSERIMPNWPKRVIGYPSFSSPYAPYDELPRHRWNQALQRSEYYLPRREAEVRRFPLDSRIRVNPWKPHITESDILLNAWFTGQLSTTYRKGRGFANFPTGKYRRPRLRWFVAE